MLAVLVGPRNAAAQRQPDRVFTLDVEWLGGALTYAWETGPGRYTGIAAGLGGSVWSASPFRGDRSHDGGTMDGRPGLVELVHGGAFRRWIPSGGFTAEAGPRAALMVATVDSGASGLVAAVGLHASVHVGTDRIQAGPRMLAGYFIGGDRDGFGLLLVPLSLRVSQGW